MSCPVHPAEPASWRDLRARAATLGALLASGPPPLSAQPAAWRDAAAADVARWLADVAAADGGRDPALVAAVSDLCAALGAGGEDSATAAPTDAALPHDTTEQTFHRTTAKFFVPPHAAPALKLALAARLPLCLPGRPRLGADRAARVAPPAGRHVTSIYFDGPRFPDAAARAARVHGATAVRVRWYGDDDASPPPPPSVFLETKTRSTVDAPASKQRVLLPTPTLLALTAGGGDVPPGTPALAAALAPRLAPPRGAVARTAASRWPFGAADAAAGLRVTLDEDVEYGAVGDRLSAGPVAARLCVAVLEIKLPRGGQPPDWLASVLTAATATPVAYSKFVGSVVAVHGPSNPQAAVLAAGLPAIAAAVAVAPSPPRPHTALEVGPPSPKAAALPTSPHARRHGRLARLLAAARGRRQRAAGALPLTRVEPKTFFANERTLIAWLQVAVLVLLLATSLLDGSVGKSKKEKGVSSSPCATTVCRAVALSGAVIAPAACALILYSFAVFRARARALRDPRRAAARFDAVGGPAALVALAALGGGATVVAAFAGFAWRR